MIAFIDDHRGAYGVEPICRVLPIAPSTYHAHVARRADPALLPDRAKRDAELKPEIKRVFEENFGVYGVPETFIVAGDGTIAYKFVGPMSPAAVEKILLPAIQRGVEHSLHALAIDCLQVMRKKFQQPAHDDLGRQLARLRQHVLAMQRGGLACAPQPGETWWDTCAGEGGKTVTFPVTLRARGHFRRQARNCDFPPLWLNWKSSDAKASIFNGRSWTVPTLAGTKLYARDRKTIAAFDLS